MDCHLCRSSDRVEMTARAFDSVPMCRRCWRTRHYNDGWIVESSSALWWFWRVWYRLKRKRGREEIISRKIEDMANAWCGWIDHDQAQAWKCAFVEGARAVLAEDEWCNDFETGEKVVRLSDLEALFDEPTCKSSLQVQEPST